MKIEVQFFCDFCGREIDVENEQMYKLEKIFKDGIEVNGMCEDCHKIALENLRIGFQKTICGLN